MATILEPNIRAVDASGKPVIGASLTIYAADSTTPAAIFRDADLSVPMTNPTTGSDKSGADGYFPQFFAVEGQTFDIVCKKPDGTTLWSRLAVPSLGSDSVDVTRDFGTGGRLRITGSGGVVRFEGGDPTGDDVGGHPTVGGYNGSQAATVTLDGAIVDATGKYTENGKDLPGIVATGKTTFAAVASQVIALPNVPAGVAGWEVDVFDLVLTGSVTDLLLTVSIDGGVTYLGGSYVSDLFQSRNGTVSSTTTTGTATAFTVASSVITGTAHWSRIRVHGKIVRAETIITGTVGQWMLAGYQVGATSPITHIKIAAAAGTMAGAYRVVPLRGFN